MPYIKRDENNKIICQYACKQYEDQEYLDDNSEELIKSKEKQEKNIKLQQQMDEIDRKSIRALREAILTGDKTFLQKHENDIKELRNQLIK